ncbi:MAG: hypothetical protein JST80_10435 [Bdellovibrionales bacterium]|nr:hypothetical protein [Bdellovibrionales bacterium]
MKTVSILSLLILAVVTEVRAEMTTSQTNANEPYYCEPCKKWIFPKLGSKNDAVAPTAVVEDAVAPGEVRKANDAVDPPASGTH